MTTAEIGMMLFAMFAFQVGIAGAIKTSRLNNDYPMRVRVLMQLTLYVLLIGAGWLFTKDDLNAFRDLIQVIMTTSVAFIIAMLITRSGSGVRGPLHARIANVTQPRARRRSQNGTLLRRPGELGPGVIKEPEHLFDFRV